MTLPSTPTSFASMTNSRRNRRWKRLGLLLSLAVAGKLIYNGVSSIDATAIQNNNGGKVQVIGHGGIGVQSIFPFQWLPCNTPTSIQKCFDNGLEGIELDVQMTADSVLVIYHDHYLEDATGETGCIGDRNWADIKGITYQIGAPFDWIQEEPLISLEEALDMCLEQEVFPLLYLDFHGFNFCHEEDVYLQFSTFCKALDRLMIRKGIPNDRIYLIGIHDRVIKAFKALEFKPVVVVEETVDFEQGIERTLAFGLKHLQAKRALLTKENVQKAHDAGLFVITHQGKTRWGLKQRVELGVDAIQADAPVTLKEMLE